MNVCRFSIGIIKHQSIQFIDRQVFVLPKSLEFLVFQEVTLFFSEIVTREAIMTSREFLGKKK